MFHACLYYTVFSVPCNLVITCWEKAGLLALLCVTFPCVFVTFPYGVSGKVFDCIDSQFLPSSLISENLFHLDDNKTIKQQTLNMIY